MVPVTCDRSSEVLPLLTFFLREERNKFLKQFQSCSALRPQLLNHFVLQNNSLISAAILEKSDVPPSGIMSGAFRVREGCDKMLPSPKRQVLLRNKFLKTIPELFCLASRSGESFCITKQFTNSSRNSRKNQTPSPSGRIMFGTFRVRESG